MAAGAAPGKWGMEVLAVRKLQAGERRAQIFVDGSKAAQYVRGFCCYRRCAGEVGLEGACTAAATGGREADAGPEGPHRHAREGSQLLQKHIPVQAV